MSELRTTKLNPSRLEMTTNPLDISHTITDRELPTLPTLPTLTGDPLGNHNLPFDSTMTVAEAMQEITTLRSDITALRQALANSVVVV